jgi:hypothetical protein
MVALRNCSWSSDEAKDGPDRSGYLALMLFQISVSENV